MPDVVEDTAEEGGECRDVAGTEQVEGVGLDVCWPVGLVCVEGVEETFLDPRRQEEES